MTSLSCDFYSSKHILNLTNLIYYVDVVAKNLLDASITFYDFLVIKACLECSGVT